MKIPLSLPDITDHEVEAVNRVLASPNISAGPFVPEFEGKIAQFTGSSHVVAVNSGTSALHLIVRGLGLGPGDEVITTSFSFAASTNCLLFEGVQPVYADIDPRTLCIDPEKVEAGITPRTRAILSVDVFGHPADYDALRDIGRRYGLYLIADTCEALGARYKGTPVGHPDLADAAAFAFYANKQITTGEGGVLLTCHEELARVARSLRNQGRGDGDGWLQHERLGYNYRLDEMSAAMGSAQMDRLEEILARRDQVAQWYIERLREVPGVEPPYVAGDVKMSWFVFVVRLAPSIDRGKVMARLAARGIASREYFAPIHQQPYLRDYDVRVGDLLVTEEMGRRTLALPFFTSMAEEQVEAVVRALDKAVKEQR